MSTSGAEITFVDLWRLKFDFPKCLCKPQRKSADGEKKILFVCVCFRQRSITAVRLCTPNTAVPVSQQCGLFICNGSSNSAEFYISF